MPAQIDLDRRREPAQIVVVAAMGAFGHEERGFREIVLSRDRLHRRVRQPDVEGADGGRVAGEQPACERINLIERELHWSLEMRKVLISIDAQLCHL